MPRGGPSRPSKFSVNGMDRTRYSRRSPSEELPVLHIIQFSYRTSVAIAAFRGVWSLNVEKSKFADRPKPKMQQLNWTERGWAFAMVRADGGLYADASVIDRDCKMIGVESDYSCEVNVVTHRHVRFMFKHGPLILRSVEIKLLENSTLEMTHTVTPAAGKPYVEKMIWERAVQEQPKASSGASAEAELRTVMAERLKASIEGDTEKIASSLADEYLQTDISGYVQDKTTWLNEYFKPLAELIKAGKFRWEVFEQKDVQIRMYGDCAVVIGKIEAKGSGARPTPQHTWVADPKASFSRTLSFTHAYLKRNWKWLLADLHNAVPLPPPPPAKPRRSLPFKLGFRDREIGLSPRRPASSGQPSHTICRNGRYEPSSGSGIHESALGR